MVRAANWSSGRGGITNERSLKILPASERQLMGPQRKNDSFELIRDSFVTAAFLYLTKAPYHLKRIKMQITSSDEIDWANVFLHNEYIVVNYQPSSDCEGCKEINELFQRLDKFEEYRTVKFLWVDSRNNPIAEQFIKKTQKPFMAAFKDGFLVECNVVSTDADLKRMILRLFSFKFKL
ncbi:MAG: hypothetical protein V4565_14555 [Bacteroidota bacterium]